MGNLLSRILSPWMKLILFVISKGHDTTASSVLSSEFFSIVCHNIGCEKIILIFSLVFESKPATFHDSYSYYLYILTIQEKKENMYGFKWDDEYRLSRVFRIKWLSVVKAIQNQQESVRSRSDGERMRTDRHEIVQPFISQVSQVHKMMIGSRPSKKNHRKLNISSPTDLL